MKQLRLAIFGTGFWARFQLAAWRELPGVECVALYNRTRGKAEALAREFGVPAVYDDGWELLARARLALIDVITDVGTHGHLVRLAAAAGRACRCWVTGMGCGSPRSASCGGWSRVALSAHPSARAST